MGQSIERIIGSPQRCNNQRLSGGDTARYRIQCPIICGIHATPKRDKTAELSRLTFLLILATTPVLSSHSICHRTRESLMTSSFPLYPAKELDFFADFDPSPICQAETGQPALFISVPNPYLCPYADPRHHKDETPQGKQCLLKRRLVVISHRTWDWLVEARGVEPLSESALTGLSPGADRF